MPSAVAERLTRITHLDVSLDGQRVGTLARSRRSTTMFEYAPEWLSQGFSISPLSLPLRPGLFESTPDMPDSIFGIFRDSIPDDWGRLLQDRKLAGLGVRPGSLTSLVRLALVGQGGLGALEYAPEQSLQTENRLPSDWDALSQQCQAIMADEESEALDSIYARGSSSGGARPKVMVELDGEPWIVKFPTTADGPQAGMREHNLAEVAKRCGIAMSKTKLIPSRLCAGYFATKRFDRYRDASGGLRKIHMASAAALLEASPFDVLDYRDLMQLTLEVTGSVADCEQLYRVMCLNVAVGNCDDHARNFSYLYEDGTWRLAPAYDLTQDEGFFGEHATLVNGKGADITETDLVAVGLAGGLSARRSRRIAHNIARIADDI